MKQAETTGKFVVVSCCVMLGVGSTTMARSNPTVRGPGPPKGEIQSVNSNVLKEITPLFRDANDGLAPGPDHPPLDQIPPILMPMTIDQPLLRDPGVPVIHDAVTGKTVELPVGEVREGDPLRQPGFDGVAGNFDTEALTRTFWDMSQITNTEDHPWRMNVKVIMRFVDQIGNDRWFACSGSMIDAETVLTAGHCVYARTADGPDIFDWAKEIWVYPGKDGSEHPYGYGHGTFFGAWTGWTVGGSFDYDLGLIRITRAVGMLTGWFGTAWDGDCGWILGETYHNASYPGEGCPLPDLHNGVDMYYWYGNFDSCPGNQLQIDTGGGHCFDTVWGGMSGSGAYFKVDDSRYVHAACSNSDRMWIGRYCKLWGAWATFMNGEFIPGSRGGTFDLQALDANAEPAVVPAGSQLSLANFLATNPTNGSASGSWTVRTYLSTNSDISGGDTLLGTGAFNWTFPPMSSVRVGLGNPTIPLTTPPGDYYFGVILDPATDFDSSNNDTDGWDAAPLRVVDCITDADCDDGDVCNGHEICVGGVCQPGTPLNCDDENDCTEDRCDPNDPNAGLDACVHNPKPPTTPCGDPADTVCDDPDTCDGAGNCLDNHEPVTTECRPDAGECDVPEYCDGVGSCSPDGFELPGTPCGDPSDTVCDDPDTCDGSGACLDNYEPPTTLCRGDAGDCDVPEYCDGAGACPPDAFEPVDTPCSDQTETDCSNPNTCDGLGYCDPRDEPAGTPCPNDLWCDGDEFCDGAGVCLPDDPRCNDGIACTTDPCNEFIDECVEPVPHDALCDDGDVCTGVETCNPETGDPVTGCLAGVPPDCDDGNDCTADWCDPVEGCKHDVEPPGTPCPNGLWCDGDETCDGAGMCMPGANPCDDGILCTAEPCDEAADSCILPPYPHDELCDDGDYCNGVEKCDPAIGDPVTGCVAGVAPNCEDEFDCTVDTCNEVTDSCDHTPDDNVCDNGLFCDGAETCDPVRDPVDGCLAGMPPCDDGLDCTEDCDEDADVCRTDPVSCGLLELTLHAEDGCFTSEQDVCVTVDVSALDGQAMIGGQFFIEYDACLLEFVCMAPGDHPEPGIAPCLTPGESPFSSEIYENVTVDGCEGRIEYAVGLPLGGEPSADDNTMATIHFVTIYPDCPSCLPPPAGQGDGWIRFDLLHNPPTQLSDYLGTPDFPELGDEIPITVDDNPPVFGDNDPDFDNWCEDIGPLPNDPGECSAIVGVVHCKMEDYGTAENPGCGLCDLSWSRSDGLPLHAPYPAGITCITWVAIDCAGNVTAHDQCITVDDEEPPEITCPEDRDVPTDPGTCEADVDPGMATCTDNCECDVTCERDDGKDCWNDPYPVGCTTLTWCASDEAGNETCCEQRIWVRDEEPPTIDCPDDETERAVTGRCDADVDPGMATCTDNCNGCTVTCKRGDDLDCHNDPYPVGCTTLTWCALDEADPPNEVCCEQTVCVRDEEPPTIDCPPDKMERAVTGRCDADVDPGMATCADNCDVCTVSCERDDGKNCWNDPYPVGRTTLTWCAKDEADPPNETCCEQTVTVTDEEPPSFVCFPDKTVATDPGTCEACVDPDLPPCDDNCENCSVTCQRGDARDCWKDCYPVGCTTLTWCASDDAGNKTCCEQTICVYDNEPPGITCPADKTVPTDPGVCEAMVDPGMATCTDNCQECLVSCERDDGKDCTNDPYPVGCTTLTWCAKDEANPPNEACCEQTVCVKDEEPPMIDCPPDKEEAAATGRCDANVDPGMATCSDNCECEVTCERDDGKDCRNDPYPVRTTMVTWCARDLAGNETCCEQTVTVTDEQDPIITCPDDKEICNDEGNCEANVDPGMATCTDNCECAVTCERDDGFDCWNDPYPVGTTILTWTSTDLTGNTGTCQQTVTVNDCEAPIITCPDDIEVPPDPSECGAVVPYPDPDVSDNCPGVTWECVPPSGSFVEVGTTTVTCTATDEAGNTSECSFTVTVTDINGLDLIIRSEAACLNGDCDRCITFTLYSCDDYCQPDAVYEFEEALTFVRGVALEKLDVPYGDWACISAKDELHTLQSTVPLGVSEQQFVADFTGGDRLLCGDATNDNVVDINDYAILFTQYMMCPEFPITKCEDEQVGPPPPYHADFDCNGCVATGDFLCILINFLQFGDEPDACCLARPHIVSKMDGIHSTEKSARMRDRVETIVSREEQFLVARTASVSVAVNDIARKIGVHAAVAADIDGNGVLDVNDIASFAESKGIALPERFQKIRFEHATPVDGAAPTLPRQ